MTAPRSASSMGTRRRPPDASSRAGSVATRTVPGSSTRVAGVINVGVSAAARRRGVGSALLRTQLADSHRAGFVATALWASEPRIYGRYGYGVGSDLLALEIPRDRTALELGIRELSALYLGRRSARTLAGPGSRAPTTTPRFVGSTPRCAGTPPRTPTPPSEA